MINLVNFFNFRNSFFGLSLSLFNCEKKYFVISYIKVLYCTILLILIPTSYPSTINFLMNMLGNQIKNKFSKSVTMVQTTSQYLLNISLLLFKLIYCNKDILCQNQYLLFKEKFAKSLKCEIISQRKIKVFLVINSVILFLLEILSLLIVLLCIFPFSLHGFPYIFSYIFYYFQIAAAGNGFIEKVLQNQFMILCINHTLKDYLETLKYEIKYRSRAHCIMISSKISDDINILTELNSKIYSLFLEVIRYESLPVAIAILHKFLEIIVPLFYQFVARFFLTEHYHIESQFIVFGLIYLFCNVSALILYANICESMHNEVRILRI